MDSRKRDEQRAHDIVAFPKQQREQRRAERGIEVVRREILFDRERVVADHRLADARAAFVIADEIKVQTANVTENGGLVDAAYDYYNATEDELEAAQNEFNGLLGTKADDDVQYARGLVLVSQQRYDAAYKRLLSFQTGAESPAVGRCAQCP